MRDARGHLQGVVCDAQDVTDRLRSREELRQAKDAAEQASQAKSTFLANMSHELRTPLNAIIGYSEMLMEEAVDRGQADFVPDLQKISAAAQHLLALINDILDLSKIEAGKMELHVEEFDVQRVVTDVVAIIQPLALRNKNEMHVECEDVGTMFGDLMKVRQTLFNLLSNACKFTDNGTVTLRVKRSTDRSGEWLTFEVGDTGIGMGPEQMSRLFKAFSQADTSTTRRFGGTGLGLAISRKFCLLMGGDISVQTEPNRGSCFTVTLPRRVVVPLAAVGGSHGS
jgi:signal transduction histidine kinase